MKAKCPECGKVRKLSEYTDVLTGKTVYLCWDYACGGPSTLDGV